MRARVGEAVAIVLSILLAFAIDAGWDRTQDRREEREILDDLAQEYRANLAELDQVDEWLESSSHVMEWALNATDAEIATLGDWDIGRVLMGLALPFTFDPNLGTTEALRSSGRLSLLRDPELPRLLMRFTTLHEDAQEDRDYLAEQARRIWEEEVRVGGPWTGGEAAETTLGARLIRDARTPSLDDLRRVRSDPTLPGLVRRFQLNVAMYRSELADLRGVLIRVLERLPEEEGRPGSEPSDRSAAVLLDPGAPEWSETAPDRFDAVFHTTAGEFRLRVHRAWARIGADRFWNLARHGFYDGARIHRVVPGFITQFGISGRPDVDAVWYDRGMPDDPVEASNVRGTVAYAFTEPGTRSTQLYVNMVDNVRLDSTGFAPIGRIVSGMSWTVDSIFGGYGEDSGGGVRRGNQAPLVEGGNAFIDAEWPELDRILRVTIEARGP